MRIPKYRKHSTGHGFYEYRGERRYLPGAYNSPESVAAYKQFVQELCQTAAGERVMPAVIGVLVEQWLAHCEAYYSGGTEYDKCAVATRALAPYLLMPVADFGPKRLKEIQQTLAKEELTRNYINAIVNRLKRMFKWAASEELIDVSIAHAMGMVPGLPKGRTPAKESTPRTPVLWEHVLPVLSQVSPTIRTMILLEWYTGARGKSIRLAKPEQFDQTKTPWEWRPQHKTEHLGKELVLFLGPQARKLLARRLARTRKGRYLFRPSDARSNGRYGKFYSRNAFAQAVTRGIERANKQRKIENKMLPKAQRKPLIPHWTPHQIRHSRGTDIRARHGLEGAQAYLGHDSIDATQIYARAQLDKARAIAEAEG